MAADEVDGLATEDVAEGVGVALRRGDALGHTGLGAAPGQGRQGIGAGVADGNVVAVLRERDGEAAGAAPEVEHAQRP